MKKHKTYTVAYRRKREGKTDYKKRISLLMADKPRLIVRKSLKNITAQIVSYDSKGDKVIASANGSDLKKMGWKYNCGNVPSAYLIGMIVAKKAATKDIKSAILDIGLNKSIPGSRVFAVLKGASDNGLDIPHSESVLPGEDRLTGKNVEEYAKKLKEDEAIYSKRFSAYIKSGSDPLTISKSFEETKKKIIGA